MAFVLPGSLPRPRASRAHRAMADRRRSRCRRRQLLRLRSSGAVKVYRDPSPGPSAQLLSPWRSSPRNRAPSAKSSRSFCRRCSASSFVPLHLHLRFGLWAAAARTASVAGVILGLSRNHHRLPAIVVACQALAVAENRVFVVPRVLSRSIPLRNAAWPDCCWAKLSLCWWVMVSRLWRRSRARSALPVTRPAMFASITTPRIVQTSTIGDHEDLAVFPAPVARRHESRVIEALIACPPPRKGRRS